MIKALHDKRRPMTCADFENRVNELLDLRQDLAADKFLIGHAAVCKQCEGVIEGYSIFNELEFGNSTTVVVNETKQGAKVAGRRWPVLAVVAAALVTCCLLLVDVSEVGENNSVAVALTEPAVADVADVQAWEAGETEPISSVAVASGEKMPASLKVGHAFAATNLGTVNWEDLGKNLESLQPVLGYSRRIPVVSSVRSTVDLTIGLMRAKKQEGDLPAMDKNTTPDYGFLLNRYDGLA